MIWFWNALPVSLFNAPLSPVLLDKDGVLLAARIASDGQWRFAQRAAPSARYVEALIEFEDKRFHAHPGVDPLALARALKDHVSRNGPRSGASTISMQVIRMARGNPPRSVLEKLHEMVLALRLELRFSKDEILALYAQHAPFGGNTVGLDTAAWRYFQRDAKDLSWAEAATLAVLPNSPALIHPGRGRVRLHAKRDRLLHALHAQKKLTDLDLRLALAEPLAAAPGPVPRIAPHLLDSLMAGVFHGGQAPEAAVFRSTLEASLQQELQAVLDRAGQGLKRQGVKNAAMLLIDNRDFSTRAYVGNLSTAEQAADVDIVQAARSSGSILKPLLYALMLESGQVLPSMLVPDVPTQIMGYVPENFDREYRGAVRADEALARSLNIPAVRLLREFSVQRFHAALKNMGFRDLFRTPEDYGLTLVLGGGEVRLWDVAKAYAQLAQLAASKKGAALRYLDVRVLQKTPSQIRNKPARAEFGAGAAWLTLHALQEVNRPGVEQYWRAFSSSRTVSWKTGTSFGLRDAWAVAVTPHYTLAVWAGNADGSGVAELSGTQTAAPILFDALNRLPDAGNFVEPFDDLKLVEVCANDGYLPQNDCAVETQRAPKHAHFEKPSPHQQRIHLDATHELRVHAECEPVDRQRVASWFVLPPAAEYFWRQRRSDYRPLPAWRRDCLARAPRTEQAIGLLYPAEDARVYIPFDLDGKRSRLVMQAVHRRKDARLFWHLDDQYLGETRGVHQQAVLTAGGAHQLTLVDEEGLRLTRRFVVLEK